MIIIDAGLVAAMVIVPETRTSRARLDLRPRLTLDASLRGRFLAAIPCLVAISISRGVGLLISGVVAGAGFGPTFLGAF